MPWELFDCTAIDGIPFTTGGVTYDQLQGTYDDLVGTYNDLSPTIESDVMLFGFLQGSTAFADPTISYDFVGEDTATFDSYVISKIFTQPKNDAYFHECRVYYKALTTGNIELWISKDGSEFVLDTTLSSIEPLDQEFIRTRKVRRGRTYQFKVVIEPVDDLADNQGQVQLTGYEIDSSLAGESKR